MSTLIAKLAREPALLIGFVAAVFGVLVAFGVDLTEKQTGAIILAIGAAMALVRYLTTPKAEVAVQVKPNGDVVAGPAAVEPTGSNVVAGGDVGDDTVAAVAIKPELLT